MMAKALKTAKDYDKWKKDNEERKERLLGEDLPWETGTPEERERWETWFKDRRLGQRASREEAIGANAEQLAEAGVENATAADAFTLTSDHPLVNMIGLGWKVNPRWLAAGPELAPLLKIPKVIQWDTPPELTVTGLGEYAGRRRARVAPVELTVFDLSNRPVEHLGITDDDKMILPDIAARVLFVLKDRKRGGVTVSLNRGNRMSRGDWPPPADWLVYKWRKEPKGAME